MRKEYGGYLPLELPEGSAYYQGDDVIELNSGRYAAVYALQEGKWKRIFLPYYICSTVEDAIKKHLPGTEIQYYHIDQRLLPCDTALKDDDCILWVNYFGIQEETQIDEIIRRYKGHLIIDNTQAFFAAPRNAVWQIYSCRKFFGVSDGSYAIHRGIAKRPLKQHFSSRSSVHLLQSLEFGTDAAYTISKENEARLDDCGIGLMSPLTRAIMNSIDYPSVYKKRLANAEALHRLLGKYNLLDVPNLTSVMNYPFLCRKEGLREALVENKIYVPMLWKEALENPCSSPWEKFLSEHLCALPIDQRYSTEDMDDIGHFVIKLL